MPRVCKLVCESVAGVILNLYPSFCRPQTKSVMSIVIRRQYTALHLATAILSYKSYTCCFQPVNCVGVFIVVLGPRYTKLGLQAGKNQARQEYKNNIAMTDCQVILYPA